MVVVVVLGLAVGALAARDLLSVRRRLLASRSVLSTLAADPSALATEGERRAAMGRIDGALAELKAASETVRGSVPLRVVALGPGLDYQKQGLVRLIDDAAAAAGAGRRILEVTGELQATPIAGGAVPLASLERFQGVVQSAEKELRRVTRGRRGLWGGLGEARTQLDAVTGPGAARLRSTADTLGALRPFFGQGEVRRYFVAGLNNAEMRAQGMVLSFAVIRFEAGRMTFERTDPIDAITLARPAPLTLPPGTTAVFGPLLPTQEWRSVNATADFPLAARTMVAMYQEATGQRLDGVVALDVLALRSILEVVGPVDVAGLGTLSNDNAVPVLLSRQYEGLPPGSAQAARRERVAQVAGAMAGRLRQGDVDAVALGRRLGTAAAGRHLLLWSSRAEEERVFERVGLGGGPVSAGGGRADRTFHIAVQDATGTKVDYHVRPRVHMDVVLTPAGTAVVRTKVIVQNEAPPGVPPSYALGPNSAATSAAGQYVGRVYFWGPAGAAQPDAVEESGLLLSQKPVFVEPGGKAEVVFETVISGAARNGRLSLTLVPQPRHEATLVEAMLSRADHRPHRTYRARLERTARISWVI